MPSVYARGPVLSISRTLPAGIVVVLPNHRLAPSQGGHPHPDILRRDEVQVGSLRALDIRIALMPSTLGSALPSPSADVQKQNAS